MQGPSWVISNLHVSAVSKRLLTRPNGLTYVEDNSLIFSKTLRRASDRLGIDTWDHHKYLCTVSPTSFSDYSQDLRVSQNPGAVTRSKQSRSLQVSEMSAVDSLSIRDTYDASNTLHQAACRCGNRPGHIRDLLESAGLFPQSRCGFLRNGHKAA